MRRFLLFILFYSQFTAMNAVGFGAGIMFGANTAASSFKISTPLKTSDSKLGYNFNGFVRVKILSFLIQPEFGYTLNRSGFTIIENSKTIETTLSNGELYSSVLLGYKLGSLRFMCGPMAYSTLSESTNSVPLSNLQLTTASTSPGVKFGGQVGLGLDVSKHFTIDARYQRMLTNSSYLSTVENVVKGFDGNLGAISLSIGYSIFKL
jgi:hypothetical protein